MGADPKAFVLQAQRSRVDGWGYYLLRDWTKARADIDPLWAQVSAETLPVGDFATRAQELTERQTSF
jgi:hypothetical protein